MGTHLNLGDLQIPPPNPDALKPLLPSLLLVRLSPLSADRVLCSDVLNIHPFPEYSSSFLSSFVGFNFPFLEPSAVFGCSSGMDNSWFTRFPSGSSRIRSLLRWCGRPYTVLRTSELNRWMEFAFGF
ncbi:hypothetical protein ACLOJK_011575 [Asimina triloba]